MDFRSSISNADLLGNYSVCFILAAMHNTYSQSGVTMAPFWVFLPEVFLEACIGHPIDPTPQVLIAHPHSKDALWDILKYGDNSNRHCIQQESHQPG